ncbi:hypothetical protein HMPREF9455_00087 [Dysgonomonas gadei ATCC BAA-286]|uniref:Uncharacterized protein n=1 Tax=Dysgonomonas gadei ATCC BAA-286 TaxID=742766 RepID=F5ISM0_9BACT|nr:hypothetical protein HMPREF9455_00087 [Dysgonomonas gadei ATCC BAA-286]
MGDSEKYAQYMTYISASLTQCNLCCKCLQFVTVRGCVKSNIALAKCYTLLSF